MASNYLVTLLHVSSSMISNVDDASGYKRLVPLLRQTVETLAAKGPEKGLTGPISRGDVETVEMHLNALAHDRPELLSIYKALGLATVDLAADSLSDSVKVETLKRLLTRDDTE